MALGLRRARLWGRCTKLVAELDLPHPFDVEEFIASLAARRGRHIEIVPVAAKPNLPCGIVLTTLDADLILYRADTTALHREHILLHEAAHILCGHNGAANGGAGGGTGGGANGGTDGRSDSGSDSGAFTAAARQLMPHLSPELIRNVLGRTVYREPEEREAELIATLIRQRVERRRDAAADAAAAEAGSAKLDAVFGVTEA